MTTPKNTNYVNTSGWTEEELKALEEMRQEEKLNKSVFIRRLVDKEHKQRKQKKVKRGDK